MGLGVLFNRQQGWLLRGPFCSIASRAGSYEDRFVPSPAGLAPTRAVLFHRQQGWLLRGPFCSIASRAGSYEGRFVPSPAGLAPTRAVLFHRQRGWLLRGLVVWSVVEFRVSDGWRAGF